MKKAVSLIMALVLILTLSTGAYALYDNLENEVSMMPGVVPVVVKYTDGTFDYVLYAKNLKGMTNIDMTVSYDDSFKVLDYTAGDDFLVSSVNTDIKNIVYFSAMFLTESKSEGFAMLSITFDVVEESDSYPTAKLENLAGAFIKKVQPVKVIEGKERETAPIESPTTTPVTPPLMNLKGDVNLDMKITAADARIILRHATMLDKIPDDMLSLADVNGDGKITATDARIVLRVSVGLEKFDEG